jgi:ATP-dependent exoDNAse (exonuclease V) alpha subunit
MASSKNTAKTKKGSTSPKSLNRESVGLPLRHLSIRVPWHDSGWDGTVCRKPKENAACLALNRIRDGRNDDLEDSVAGQSLSDLPMDVWPACLGERATFMSPFEFTRLVAHPYAATSELHSHIKPTPLRHPPFSAAAIPFRWMSKDFAWEMASQYRVDARPEREPAEPEWLAKRPWVQHRDNQHALLTTFFSAVREQDSLCFFYAKQTPLVDDDRRLLIGVGRVLRVGSPKEYDYTAKNEYGSFLWDVIVEHSIRPDFGDGFLLPYHAILQKSQADSSINPADFVAFAPDDRRDEFSYAAEHVSHDAAIGALLSGKGALERARAHVDEPCAKALRWIDDRLSELWTLRGPFPGLGAALTAFGVEHGNFLAYHLSQTLGDQQDPWPAVHQVFENPHSLPSALAAQITSPLRQKWRVINERNPERLTLLRLLARFELSNQQATRFYVQEVREKAGIDCKDEDIIANPYLLYELDRFAHSGNDDDFPVPVSVWTTDRGMFPPESIREKYPLSKPSALDGPIDVRRVRALTVESLERAAADGDTLLPRSEVVKEVRALEIDPGCPIDGDLFAAIESDLQAALLFPSMADGAPALQLRRLSEIGDVIRAIVRKRAAGKRHNSTTDWGALLTARLPKPDPTDEDEVRARTEKAAALKELADSRISVLIGPAGTGKTTLLSVLCSEPSIERGGVLLLAPTGKARVRLWQASGIPAQTLAQFLMEHDRYDPITGTYRCSNTAKVQTAKTVVVDEASMLTEEQVGALLDALAGVDRLIFVGDPRQLPPIGAGRPFVDLISLLAPSDIEARFPRVASGFSELTVRRRQVIGDGADLQLADWFSGRELAPGDDEIWGRVQKGESLTRLRFVEWADANDLRQKVIRVVAEELKLQSVDDQKGFEVSLGGELFKGYVYFRRGAGPKADAWQIMTPYRNLAFGARDLNRLMQLHFRRDTVKFANERHRKIPKPMGVEEIVYGDKVINVANRRRPWVYPKDDALKYVANGEIGVAVGQFKGRNAAYQGYPWKLEVEFSSQPGFAYDYTSRDFQEEGVGLLELAYVVTVHKAQGSEFGISILILPNPCRLLSRELLYTAITRQKDRVVVMHQGSLTDLKKYSSQRFSETARRLTNLFVPPKPVAVDDVFLEANLIHRSGQGVLMRSKSEVIIADALAEAGIHATYEQPLIGADGVTRYPDFTIEDSDSGLVYYWEHCGMLSDVNYRKRWAKKKAWYAQQGILPLEKNGGPNGTLIVTEDTLQGGIDSSQIRKLIDSIWQ